jgi:hypothetical protein
MKLKRTVALKDFWCDLAKYSIPGSNGLDEGDVD